MVVEELAKFVVLARQVREVNEESGAHVALHGLDLLWPGRPVVLDQEVAVLQQPATSDLLWTASGNELLVKMTQSVIEVAIDRLSNDGWIKVVGYWHPCTIVEQEQGVKHDVE